MFLIMRIWATNICKDCLCLHIIRGDFYSSSIEGECQDKQVFLLYRWCARFISHYHYMGVLSLLGPSFGPGVVLTPALSKPEALLLSLYLSEQQQMLCPRSPRFTDILRIKPTCITSWDFCIHFIFCNLSILYFLPYPWQH